MALNRKRMGDIEQIFAQLHNEGKLPAKAEFVKLAAAQLKITERMVTPYADELYRFINLTPDQLEKIHADSMAELDKNFNQN